MLAVESAVVVVERVPDPAYCFRRREGSVERQPADSADQISSCCSPVKPCPTTPTTKTMCSLLREASRVLIQVLRLAPNLDFGPNQLPGIVFFQDLNFESQESAQGVYWRLPLESFEGDRNILEREVAHLFAMVQTARRNAHDASSMFDERSALVKMRRSDADRQFMALLGKGLMQVVKYPGKQIEWS
jgi:hypothetical protein